MCLALEDRTSCEDQTREGAVVCAWRNAMLQPCQSPSEAAGEASCHTSQRLFQHPPHTRAAAGPSPAPHLTCPDVHKHMGLEVTSRISAPCGAHPGLNAQTD